MTHQHDDLLHARLDGELTAGQRAEVERLLASDDSARQRADQLEALGRSLDVLEPVDPPARVMHAVLAHVKRGASMADADAETATPGGVLMRTKVLWGLAAAAAIVLAFFSVTGFPPSLGGTEGAIGAAKRYQAGQIAASDVKLGDQSRAGVPAKRPVRQADEGRVGPQGVERSGAGQGDRGPRRHCADPAIRRGAGRHGFAKALACTGLRQVRWSTLSSERDADPASQGPLEPGTRQATDGSRQR